MEFYKLMLLFLIAAQCVTVYTASSTLTNQIWWTKRTKQLQKGCGTMCCPGKNSTCYASGPTMGIKKSSNGRCFCDEGCLNLNDCCEDYSVKCQAVDCVVDEWEEYGACSKACGLGAKTRVRRVTQASRNGGRECPTLKESTVCFGKRCKSQRHLGARGRVDQETARIMPASFGQFRQFQQYNSHLDIRKNLFYKYYAHRTIKRRGYCATYEVRSARKSCSSHSVPWVNVLRRGTQICVECQTKAMDGAFGHTCIGHGRFGKDTFWTAVNVHGCHGWWRRTNELSECTCNHKEGLDFIFV